MVWSNSVDAVEPGSVHPIPVYVMTAGFQLFSSTVYS